jgi:hypothetical protein
VLPCRACPAPACKQREPPRSPCMTFVHAQTSCTNVMQGAEHAAAQQQCEAVLKSAHVRARARPPPPTHTHPHPHPHHHPPTHTRLTTPTPTPTHFPLTQSAGHVPHLRHQLRHVAHRMVQPLQPEGWLGRVGDGLVAWQVRALQTAVRARVCEGPMGGAYGQQVGRGGLWGVCECGVGGVGGGMGGGFKSGLLAGALPWVSQTLPGNRR